MKSSLALLLAAGLLAGDYRLALPGYRYRFPRDHFNHEEFRTEWWYWTGNLRTPEGRRFGFELTFFRHGVDRSAAPAAVWDVRDVWLAHLALSDIEGGRFLHSERLNRAGPGLAGAALEQARVWNGNWQARWTLDPAAPGGVASQQLQAVAENFRLRPQPAARQTAGGPRDQRREPEGGGAGKGLPLHILHPPGGPRRRRNRRAALCRRGPRLDGP